MHTNLDESGIAGRLRAAGRESGEAPYDWGEFQRRRHRSLLTRAIERHRPAAIAAAVLAAVIVTAVPFLRSSYLPGHVHTSTVASEHAKPTASQVAATHPASDRQERARTRAIEGWLAGLPHDRVIVRVGTHAAVSGLQDQIAALDDLMSTERAAGAQPRRLEALERQRAQLVSSLAQLRYAELLASATP